MDTINKEVEKSGEHSLGEKLLDSTFDTYWTELEAKLEDIVAKPPEKLSPSRDTRDIVEEILEILRRQERRQRQEHQKPKVSLSEFLKQTERRRRGD